MHITDTLFGKIAGKLVFVTKPHNVNVLRDFMPKLSVVHLHSQHITNASETNQQTPALGFSFTVT